MRLSQDFINCNHNPRAQTWYLSSEDLNGLRSLE